MKKHLGFLLLAGGLVLTGCGDQASAPATQPAPSSSGSVATAPLDYISAAGKAQQSMIKKLDVAALNSAVQLFNAQEGRYPKDLNELVSMIYIGELPPAPQGMKLEYDAAQGKVSVVKKQ